MIPRNDDRIFIVGIWFAILKGSNERLTTLCYRSLTEEKTWEIKEVLVDHTGAVKDRDAWSLTGTDCSDSVIDYVTALFNIYLEKGLLTKMIVFTPQTDDVDIYERILDVFTGLGISMRVV